MVIDRVLGVIVLVFGVIAAGGGLASAALGDELSGTARVLFVVLVAAPGVALIAIGWRLVSDGRPS